MLLGQSPTFTLEPEAPAPQPPPDLGSVCPGHTPLSTSRGPLPEGTPSLLAPCTPQLHFPNWGEGPHVLWPRPLTAARLLQPAFPPAFAGCPCLELSHWPRGLQAWQPPRPGSPRSRTLTAPRSVAVFARGCTLGLEVEVPPHITAQA